jgi:SAM-dependent methyltransferase
MDPDSKAHQEQVARAYQDQAHAEGYSHKHERSWSTRFRDRREQALVHRAFASIGTVKSILDCPCGTGRFWGTLSRYCSELHVADASAEMIEAGRAQNPEIGITHETVARAQDLPHEGDSIDVVFCSRLLHHFPERSQRVEILSSLAAVARRHVVFSIWLTGNLKHSRDRSRARHRPEGDVTRFFVRRQDLEDEIRAAGLAVRSVLHKLRGISPLAMVVTDKTI